VGYPIYSGALDLFAGWGDVKQVTIQSTYLINDTLNIVVSNKGSTAVEIDSVGVYFINGTLLGQAGGPGKIGPAGG